MFILKVKGKVKIPDYIQIRDENFKLIAYFRVDRPMSAIIKKLNLKYSDNEFLQLINELPFGKITSLAI